MAYIGYIVEGDEGKPVAAGLTYEETFGLAFKRMAELYAGDFWAMQSTSIAVQERDLTDEQLAEFERIVAEVEAKHRGEAGREALK